MRRTNFFRFWGFTDPAGRSTKGQVLFSFLLLKQVGMVDLHHICPPLAHQQSIASRHPRGCGYDGMCERTPPCCLSCGFTKTKKNQKALIESQQRFSICNPWLVNGIGQLPQLRINFTDELQFVFEASFP